MYEFYLNKSGRYRLGKIKDGMFLWVPEKSINKYKCTYKCLYDFIPFVIGAQYTGYVVENGKVTRRYIFGKVIEEF